MKCRTCPTRKHCWDYGDCDSCDYGVYITKLCKKIERLKKENESLKEQTPKRGQWIKATPFSQEYCNKCGLTPKTIFGKLPPYCPNCGAKMDGKEET